MDLPEETKFEFFKRVVKSCENPDHLQVCTQWYPSLLAREYWDLAEDLLKFRDGFLHGRAAKRVGRIEFLIQKGGVCKTK